MTTTLQELLDTLPQVGRVEWIGLRSGRQQPIKVATEVEASTDAGLLGDRYAGRDGKRQVTLIQHEHLAVIGSILGIDEVHASMLRRNISVSGLNLLSLKDKRFRIGGAVMEYTGQCHPCSLMEQAFGPGGYNAVRGHGGITARVIANGMVRVGDDVSAVSHWD